MYDASFVLVALDCDGMHCCRSYGSDWSRKSGNWSHRAKGGPVDGWGTLVRLWSRALRRFNTIYTLNVWFLIQICIIYCTYLRLRWIWRTWRTWRLVFFLKISSSLDNCLYKYFLQTQTHKCSKESAACGVTPTGSLSLPLHRVHVQLCAILICRLKSYFFKNAFLFFRARTRALWRWSMLNAISLYNLSVAYTIVRSWNFFF